MGFKDFNAPDVNEQKPPVVTEKGAADSIIDKVMKAQEQIATVDAVANALGRNKGGDLGSVVISKALDVFEKQNEKVQQMVSDKDKDVVIARAEADKAKTELFSIVSKQIEGSMNSLEKMREEMRLTAEKNNQNHEKPLTFLEQLKQVKEVSALLTPAPQNNAANQQMVDTNTATVLRKMEMEHEATMKRLDMEMTKMNQDLQIRLAEFKDNHETKVREYEDSRNFRENAVSQITDIAQAAVAGFKNKTGGGVAAQPGQEQHAEEPAPSGGAGIMAAIESFPCQNCGTKLAVPEKGDKVVCPECDTTYTLKRAVNS
jgi:hypothetical protein